MRVSPHVTSSAGCVKRGLRSSVRYIKEEEEEEERKRTTVVAV